MAGSGKDKSGKPAVGPDAVKKKSAKTPTLPKLPPGTKIGKGGGGIRPTIEVPVLKKGTVLGHGGGSVRTLTEKMTRRTEVEDDK